MMIKLSPDLLKIDESRVIADFRACLGRPEIAGLLDDFWFYAAKRLILLGHQPFPALGDRPVAYESSYSAINRVFVSKGGSQRRDVATWDELRRLLTQGWQIGTERYPGLKVWSAVSGQNGRLAADQIVVVGDFGER